MDSSAQEENEQEAKRGSGTRNLNLKMRIDCSVMILERLNLGKVLELVDFQEAINLQKLWT